MDNNKIYMAAYTTNGNAEVTDKSMHLAIGGKNGFTPLNYSIGVLFAEADMSRHNANAGTTGTTRTLEDPWLFRMADGKIGVLAVAAETADKAAGTILFWITEDMITYKYNRAIRLLNGQAIKFPQCKYDEAQKEYIITYLDGKDNLYAVNTAEFVDFVDIDNAYLYESRRTEVPSVKGIEGIVSCIFEITVEEAHKIKAKLGEFENTGVKEIKLVTEAGQSLNFDTLPNITALYSDGSEAEIPVEWNENDYKCVDFNTPGCYKLRGKAVVKEYDFPVIIDRADPDVLYYNYKYYFISTNDCGQSNFYIRCANTIEGLAAAEDVLILEAAASGDMSGCNWAPELHVIGGELWMLFASGTTGRWDSVQCRMMKCCGDPMRMEDWEKPVRVLKKDGEYLCSTAITLDMTYFEYRGEHYLVWAQRDVSALSGKSYNDSSNIMIAKTSIEKPWQLINDPVEICHPRYGWDRRTTEVNEGPFIIRHRNKIFITFSGSGVDETYVLGLLTAKSDSDLCDATSWMETGYPILASEHVHGQLGPGHNSFTVDEYGRDVIVFHAKSSKESRRHMTARTVHWATDENPILYMTGERELKKEHRDITATIEVKEPAEKPSAYLFIYFIGNEPSEERLFYGVSRNGFDFRALNSGKPVHASLLGTGCIRDPFIFKGQDGFYYILATDMKSTLGWSSNYAIIVFKTKDFVNIMESTRINYRNFKATANCNRAWAPQAIWCPEKNAYMIYLAIQNPEDGLGTVMWRHYASDLMDFDTYSEPELMMKAANEEEGAIDGDIIYDSINGRYIMYYDGKRVAVSSSLCGEFDFIDPGTGTEYGRVPMYTSEGVDMGVEGSNIYKIIGKEQWVIAADGTPFNGGCYALAETTDFIHYRQLRENEYSFDFTPRHGYVIPITESQLQRLFEAYGRVDIEDRKPDQYTLKINTKEKGVSIPDNMIGLFFEDLNNAVDGGIYSELINNRSFEAYHAEGKGGGEKLACLRPIPEHGWSLTNGATAQYLSERPLNENNTTYLRLTAKTAGCGIENDCYGGFSCTDGECFNASFYARGGYKGSLNVLIIDGETVLGSSLINGFGSEFQKYNTVIAVNGESKTAVVKLVMCEAGTLDLDMISLMSRNTYNGRDNGLRKDVVEMLRDIHPGFLRFPGGCIVEGYDINNRYQWKNTVGPVETRKQNWNRWQVHTWGEGRYGYCQTYGLGFYEYFLLCEDLGCEPLPVLNCGMACQYQSKELANISDVTDVYIQDVLDLIEFANGDSKSEWGSKRIAMGHTEPFNLEYVCIGNEQWGEAYFERYELFAEAINRKYPEIRLVSSSGPSSSGEYFDMAWNWLKEKDRSIAYTVDEHYYMTPEWFSGNTDRYDNYSRKGPAVFVGEYAAHGRGTNNNLEDALSEAAFLTGLEKNSDVVKMACYAPMLAKIEKMQWKPDLIWFDNRTVYGTPSYYVQLMYSNNLGSYTVKSELAGEKGIYKAVSYDKESGDIIIKFINPKSNVAEVDIVVEGEDYIAGVARVCTLKGCLSTVNSIDKPEQIAPEESLINGVGRRFNHMCQPHSFTVLRLHTKPDYAVSVEYTKIIVATGERPILPETIAVKLGDGTEKQRRADWNIPKGSAYKYAGTYVIHGKVEGTGLFAKAELQVE